MSTSAMDDYDEVKKQCKACGSMVLVKTGKTGAKYMVNGDESYHQVYKDGKHCCTSKEEAEYIKEHGSLEGFTSPPSGQYPPQPKSDPEVPSDSRPKTEEKTVSGSTLYNAGWWEENYTQAARVAQHTLKLSPDTDQHRICAMAIMHDFATLEFVRILKTALK